MSKGHTIQVILIAGLGNPGPEYKDTRHNIGRQTIEVMGQMWGVRLAGNRFHSISGRVEFESKDIILLSPSTYMNFSGKSVKKCADFFGLTPANIMVIHDDLDLPLGRIKVVSGGGSGGHKGVSSIIESLGSKLFPRIKVGIGRPRFDESIEKFVLSPFYNEEQGILDDVIHSVIEACRLYLSRGIEVAMNHINNKNYLSQIRKER